MRQVFTSRRLENAEGVAKMLEDAGIEVRIVNGRSYKGKFSRGLSYRDSRTSDPLPEVWVVRTDDLPKARQMLRDAGLMEPTRPGQGLQFRATPEPAVQPVRSPAQRMMRLRLVLLFACIIAIGWMLLR